MFSLATKKIHEDPDHSNLIGSYFSINSYEKNNDNIESVDNYTCLFEPIFRNAGAQFVPTAYNAILQPQRNSNGNPLGSVDQLDEPCNLFRLMERGLSQREIISRQLAAFIEQHDGNSRIFIEVDVCDLESNPDHIDAISAEITKAERAGLEPRNIVLELSTCVDMDPGVLFGIAQELRRLDVKLALKNVDPDSFSIQKIFQIKPFAVKFNRNWSELARIDLKFRAITRSIVDTLHDNGRLTVLSEIETATDLAFAHECGFVRCQGKYFGDPTAELLSKAIYAI